MKTQLKTLFFIPLLLLVSSLSISCSNTNLQTAILPTAILNESYSYQFEASLGCCSQDEDIGFYLSGGSLPDGLGISIDGRLIGSPVNEDDLGLFVFEVTAYDADADPPLTARDVDEEEYTLFVTRRSTNSACPDPDATTINDIYVCLGDVTQSEVSADESFDLDVAFFTNLNNSPDYNISQIDFTITYDGDSLEIDASDLDRGLLDEASDIVGASVSFTNNAGSLQVQLQSGSSFFVRAGRILTIPFTATQDLGEESYDFTITINDIVSDNNASLPDFEGVNGELVITNN